MALLQIKCVILRASLKNVSNYMPAVTLRPIFKIPYNQLQLQLFSHHRRVSGKQDIK